MLLELRKEITKGLKNYTSLNVYLPYQEIGGLTFPLLTLELEVSDNERTLNRETVTYTVKFDVYLYSDNINELISNNKVREYFNSLGIKCSYESKPSKSHHWYKQYRFECDVRIDDNNNYILI